MTKIVLTFLLMLFTLSTTGVEAAKVHARANNAHQLMTFSVELKRPGSFELRSLDVAEFMKTIDKNGNSNYYYMVTRVPYSDEMRFGNNCAVAVGKESFALPRYVVPQNTYWTTGAMHTAYYSIPLQVVQKLITAGTAKIVFTNNILYDKNTLKVELGPVAQKNIVEVYNCKFTDRTD